MVKDGGHITMYVNRQKIIDAVDDGSQLGPAYGAGWFGLRQMKWTKARYDNLVIRELIGISHIQSAPVSNDRYVQGFPQREKSMLFSVRRQ